MLLTRFLHPFAAIALIAFALFFGSNFLRSAAMGRYVDARRFEDVFYAPPPGWLPVLSLGHSEALADLMWIKGLIYFGEAMGNKSSVEHIFAYVDSILALDRKFARVYRWASTAGIYKTRTTLDDLRRATKYAKRGAAEFPDSGEMAWEAGSTIMFELVPHLTDEEEKKQLQELGAEYLQKAARLGAGPPWLALSTTKTLKKLGKLDRAVAHLEEIYLTTNDEELKRAVASQIAHLKGQAFAEALRAEQKDLVERRERVAPYLALTLFEHIFPAH